MNLSKSKKKSILKNFLYANFFTCKLGISPMKF